MIISDEMLIASIKHKNGRHFWSVADTLWPEETEISKRMMTGWKSVPGTQLPAFRAAVNALTPSEQTQLLNALVLARLTS